MMVLQLGYTACEEDGRCLCTLVRSFKLIEVNIEHGVTAVDSYRRPPPWVRTTIEDITDEPGSIEHIFEKMLLLTWHDSSKPTKELVFDSVTPRSFSQHDSSTPCKDSVCGLLHLCVIKDVMKQLSFEETELDGETCFGDVAGSGIESFGLSHDEPFEVNDLDLNLNEHVDLNVSQIETQFEFSVSEEADVGRTQEPNVAEVSVTPSK
nr:hypothetical protein [Tanacetum cinerariifolium]